MIWFAVVLLGLVVGSFLNVCIHRLPAGKSVVHPRSACPVCGALIAFYDNIPLLSFLLLRGRCRSCRAPVSWRYPVVEALNTVLYLAVYTVFGLTWSSVIYSAFASAMLVLAFIDACHRILPHPVTVGGLVLGFLTAPWQQLHQIRSPLTIRLLELLGAGEPSSYLIAYTSSLAGLLTGAGLFLLVAAGYYLLRKQEGMGHGDIIMMGFAGTVLGWPETLLTIFLGSLAGAAAGIVLIRRAGGDRGYLIPFGTFLALGAVISLLFGDRLLTWYWNLF